MWTNRIKNYLNKGELMQKNEKTKPRKSRKRIAKKSYLPENLQFEILYGGKYSDIWELYDDLIETHGEIISKVTMRSWYSSGKAQPQDEKLAKLVRMLDTKIPYTKFNTDEWIPLRKQELTEQTQEHQEPVKTTKQLTKNEVIIKCMELFDDESKRDQLLRFLEGLD